MAKTEVVWYFFRLAGVVFLCDFVGVMAQEEGSCYGSGSIALSVILTLIIGALVAVLVFLAWKKFVKAKKGQHLILETDPEKGKGEYAFDNPGFKDAGLTPVNKSTEKTKTDTGSKTKWNQWSPLGVLTLKNEKKRTLDDSAIQDLHKIVTLRSHDFTGLGFNICGNMKEGIFIKDILHRGPAFESGKLNPGDRINSVTISFEHMVYEDALAILSYASPYEVIISAKSGKLANYPGQAGRPGHPIFKSSSTVDLSHMEKSSKKRLFQPDDSSDIGSNYSSLQKTRSNATTLERTKSKSPKPNQKPIKPKNRLSQDQLKQQLEKNIVEDYKETLRMKNEIETPKKTDAENQKAENKYQKFGVQVLPMERSPKSAELSQNDNNINLEKSELVVPVIGIDEVDKKAPPPVKKREKINFNREDPLNGSGIKRDENNIPLEMPSTMMNAAVAARKNRKSIEEEEQIISPKKLKGKAPAPPESLKNYDGLSNLNKSDDSIEKMNYNSDSDIETDNQSSVNTIELNASDITVHQSEENEEKEKQNRKTASTGDLSKIKTRKTSTGTLERAQSLDITDTSMPQLAKKRKAGKIEDEYESKTSSDESLYGSALINKEPRLSLILDGLNTFQRSRLKKSTEWGNLEDAILNVKQEPSPESSCEEIKLDFSTKSPEFNALVNKIKEIKEESESSPLKNQIWPADEEFQMKLKNDYSKEVVSQHDNPIHSPNYEDRDIEIIKHRGPEDLNEMNLKYLDNGNTNIEIENIRERKSGLYGENYRSSIDAINSHPQSEVNENKLASKYESSEIILSSPNFDDIRKPEKIEIKFGSKDFINTPDTNDLKPISLGNNNMEIHTKMDVKSMNMSEPEIRMHNEKQVSNVIIPESQTVDLQELKQEKELIENIKLEEVQTDYSVNIKPVYTPRKSFESSKTILNESPRNEEPAGITKTERFIEIKMGTNESVAEKPEYNKKEETMGVKRIRDSPVKINDETIVRNVNENVSNQPKHFIEIKANPEPTSTLNSIEIKGKDETPSANDQQLMLEKETKNVYTEQNSNYEFVTNNSQNTTVEKINEEPKNNTSEVIVGIKTRNIIPENFIEIKTNKDTRMNQSIDIKTSENLPQTSIEIKSNDESIKSSNFEHANEKHEILAAKRTRSNIPGISFEIKNGLPENTFEIKSIRTNEMKDKTNGNENLENVEIKTTTIKREFNTEIQSVDPTEINSDETKYVEIKPQKPEVYRSSNYGEMSANKSMVYSQSNKPDDAIHDEHKPTIKDKIVKPDMSQVNSFILAEREASNKNLQDIKSVDTNVPDDMKVSRHSLGTLERGKRVNENVSNIIISDNKNSAKNTTENVKNFENIIVSTPDLIKNITIAEAIHDLNQVTIEGPSSLTFEIPAENDFKSHNGIKMKSNGDINKVEVGGDKNSLTYITEIQVETDSNKKNLDNDFEKYIKNFESNIKNFETNIHTFEQTIQGVAETAKKDISSSAKSSVTVNEKVDAAKELQKVQEIVEEQLKKLPEMRFTTSSYESQLKQPEKRQSQIEILRSNFEKNTKSTKSEPSPPKSRIPVLNKTPPTSPERRDSKNLDTEADKEILEIMSSHIPMSSSLKYQPKTTRNVTVTSIRSNSKIPSGLPTFNSRPPVPPRKSTDHDDVQISTNGNGSESNFRQWVFNPSDSITNITVTETKYSK